MKTRITILLLFFAFASENIFGSGNKEPKIIKDLFSPDYLNFQYAGNLGLASVGVGYLSKNEKHNFGLSYGYLPSSVNSVEVHTVSAKGAFNFRKHKLSEKAFLNGYVGTNLLYSITNNTYLKFPGYFPSDYYFANAIHFAPFLGIKIGSRKSISKFSYIELGTLDYYLFNRIRYRRSKFSDSLNLCMGLTFPLNNTLTRLNELRCQAHPQALDP
jgi:hypothetical protein